MLHPINNSILTVHFVNPWLSFSMLSNSMMSDIASLVARRQITGKLYSYKTPD